VTSAGRPAEQAGTIIVRAGIVVYASEGVAALVGRGVGEIVGRGFSEFVVPEQRAMLQDRYERRMRGEPVAQGYALAIALPGGGRRLVEIHVEQDGGDLLVHVRDLALREVRRLRLDAVATLGAALQRELGEEAIYARVREGLWALGLASALMRAEPDGVRVLWARVPPSVSEGFLARTGLALDGYLGHWNEFSRRVWSDGSAFTEDWGLEASRFMPGELAAPTRSLVNGAGIGKAAAVRLGERADADLYVLVAGDWLRGDDVPAVRLFAAQLAAALDAARTIADLSRRNAELAALNRVAELAGEATDLPGFFSRASEVLREAAGCEGVAIWVLDEAAGELVQAYVHGAPREVAARFDHAALAGPLGDILRERTPRVAEGDPSGPLARLAPLGFRSYAWVPLVVRSKPVGVLSAGFRTPAAEGRARLDLLAAAGAHIAAVVEAQRLLSDLRRRAEEQSLLGAENARLYEDLRRSYADLERAQRRIIQGERLAALGEMSAVVAHEVRNPLGVIFNSLGALRRLVRAPDDAKLLLDIVEEEADRLNRIVGDLLDFARPSTPELRPEPLERVVEDAVGAALAQRPAGVEVARDLDASVPPVPMDPRLVRQAVLNVAVNAVQAMPRGGRLTLRTRRTGEEALLEIEDTGAGIPDEVRARIFEPFFTTKASGTGLGLAVVRRIVEGHGGTVAVRSTPGEGTVFSLRFPLGRAPVEKGPAMG